MLWYRNDLLRFLFRLWRSFGSDSGFRQYLAQFFNNKIICTKFGLFNVRSSNYFPECWPLIFYFLFYFVFDPDLKPAPESEPLCIPVPVPVRQKVTVPAVPGSGSTTLLQNPYSEKSDCISLSAYPSLLYNKETFFASECLITGSLIARPVGAVMKSIIFLR